MYLISGVRASLLCLLVTDYRFVVETVFLAIFLPMEKEYKWGGLIEGGFLMVRFYRL